MLLDDRKRQLALQEIDKKEIDLRLVKYITKFILK